MHANLHVCLSFCPSGPFCADWPLVYNITLFNNCRLTLNVWWVVVRAGRSLILLKETIPILNLPLIFDLEVINLLHY